MSELVRARGGHFRLESGYHGETWLDLEPLFLRPARLRVFTNTLASRLASARPDVICGPLLGGALVAQLVALELDVRFLFTERVAGFPQTRLFSASYALPKPFWEEAAGSRVAVVDDVISAGSSARATIAEVESRGASVVAVGALLLMGEGAADLGVEAAETLPYTLWEPTACPLCAAGVALEDVH